jgi:hypothetical protein
MKNRSQLIQHLIDSNNLKSYLEVGIQYGNTFNAIKCGKKVGIDPSLGEEKEGLYRLTSDLFFETNSYEFDLIFIDGLHLYEQVIKDSANSWNCTRDGGFIVFHDCLPKSWEMCQRKVIIPEWTGDVWKAMIWFRDAYPKIECCVLDMDYGCGVIEVNKSKLISMKIPEKIHPFYEAINFDWLQSNLERLNVVESYAGFNCNS